MTVQLEVLPNSPEDYKAQLTQYRTQIMSGKGPDIFILSCEDNWFPTQRDHLFPNPEHAMYSGFFLNLDEYLESAQYIEWDDFTAPVMEAGKTAEGQMLLPMFYSLQMAKVYEIEPVLPQSWDEMIGLEESAVQNGYSQALYNFSFRNIVFGEIADNQKEEMLITEEELAGRIREGCELVKEIDMDKPVVYLPLPERSESDQWASSDMTATYVPFYNTDGGITARINTYCAISSKTEHPDAAFALIDMLMSKEFLCLELFWEESGENRRVDMPLFGKAYGLNGQPVYQDLGTNEKSFAYLDPYGEEEFQAVSEFREKITYAYLPSNVDQEVEDLFKNCLDDEDNIDSLVKKAYSTMKMMLAES